MGNIYREDGNPLEIVNLIINPNIKRNKAQINSKEPNS